MQNSIHTGYNIVQAVSIVLNTVKAVIDASREIMEGGGDYHNAIFKLVLVSEQTARCISRRRDQAWCESHAFHPVGLETAVSIAEWIQGSLEMEAENKKENVGALAEIQESFNSIDDVFDSMTQLNQAIFNVGAQMETLKRSVRQKARLYQTQVNFTIDHLVGRESGNIIYGRQLAMSADAKLRAVRWSRTKCFRRLSIGTTYRKDKLRSWRTRFWER